MSTDQDSRMEKEILAKGLTAPRVTLEEINALMEKVDYLPYRVGDTTTVHVVAMLEGFSLAIGKTACVDPANFNMELGVKYARENAEAEARDKLWEMEGYRLKFGNRFGLDQIAKACHEINRAYCLALGDHSQAEWDAAPEWQKDSARKGVLLHLSGDHGPEASHQSWMEEKKAEGWVYGEVKDPDAKTHPCMVPFAELPVEQQAKDFLFRQVVHSLK